MIIVKSIKEKPEECRGCKLLNELTYDCLINSESPAYTTCEEQYKHCPIEEAHDINVGNMDTTTHDSISAKTGKNDGDGTSGDCISRQAAIDELQGKDPSQIWDTADIEVWLNTLPSAQPEQRWIPVTEIPPRGRDLMLKIHDACNSFFYYHMGFHNGEKYFTYNFFWQRDKDLEIVGWRLCPWEEGEQDG